MKKTTVFAALEDIMCGAGKGAEDLRCGRSTAEASIYHSFAALDVDHLDIVVKRLRYYANNRSSDSLVHYTHATNPKFKDVDAFNAHIDQISAVFQELHDLELEDGSNDPNFFHHDHNIIKFRRALGKSINLMCDVFERYVLHFVDDEHFRYTWTLNALHKVLKAMDKTFDLNIFNKSKDPKAARRARDQLKNYYYR